MNYALIPLAILAILVIWVVSVYNKLITLRTRVDEAYADIDVQLRRRYDLIPNLLETVKGYAKQEKDVLEGVTQARAAAISAGSQAPHERQQAENQFSNAIRSLFAVAEAYPDLKSSANFMQLSDELADTENKLEAARRFYNANVRDFNTIGQVFPGVLVAKWFNFAPRDFFELTNPVEKEAPKVSFS